MGAMGRFHACAFLRGSESGFGNWLSLRARARYVPSRPDHDRREEDYSIGIPRCCSFRLYAYKFVPCKGRAFSKRAREDHMPVSE